jgi:phosphatidate cytidylyltransferase
MNDILVRSFSGIVFVAAVILLLYFGVYTSLIFFLLIYLLGLVEFYKLFDHSPQVEPCKIMFIALGILFFLALVTPLLMNWPIHFFLIALLPFPVLMINELYRAKKNPLTNLGVSIFGWIYLAVPLFLIYSINYFKGWEFALGLFIIVWANDTFAYLTGRFLGKNKLFERISPKKTWEGTIGGILFSILAGFLWAKALDLSLVFWLPSALAISVSAIFGDLIQSMFKRSVNVKDTGTIMPGHGGVLDRFDAVLFAAPIFFVIIYFYYN